MRKPLLIIDGDSFAHRAYHALPKTIRRAGGKGAGAILGFLRAPAEGRWHDDGATEHDQIVVIEVMAPTFDPAWWMAMKATLEHRSRSLKYLVKNSVLTADIRPSGS